MHRLNIRLSFCCVFFYYTFITILFFWVFCFNKRKIIWVALFCESFECLFCTSPLTAFACFDNNTVCFSQCTACLYIYYLLFTECYDNKLVIACDLIRIFLFVYSETPTKHQSLQEAHSASHVHAKQRVKNSHLIQFQISRPKK